MERSTILFLISIIHSLTSRSFDYFVVQFVCVHLVGYRCCPTVRVATGIYAITTAHQMYRHVDGNLELSWLQDEAWASVSCSTFEKWRTIRHFDVRRIVLPNLQIIHGRTLFKLITANTTNWVWPGGHSLAKCIVWKCPSPKVRIII